MRMGYEFVMLEPEIDDDGVVIYECYITIDGKIISEERRLPFVLSYEQHKNWHMGALTLKEGFNHYHKWIEEEDETDYWNVVYALVENWLFNKSFPRYLTT